MKYILIWNSFFFWDSSTNAQSTQGNLCKYLLTVIRHLIFLFVCLFLLRIENCWELCRNDAKFRRLTKGYQECANVVDLFIKEYFSGFWNFIFWWSRGCRNKIFLYVSTVMESAGYLVWISSFLNVTQSHASCKCCKMCCYHFSFKLISDRNQYFF